MDAIFFILVVRRTANIVDCYLIVSNCTERSVFALKLSQHDLIFFYKCKTNGWAEGKKKGMQRGSPISVVKGRDVISCKLKFMYVESAKYLL